MGHASKKKRDNKAKKDWREFEQLVYRIERLYCPNGGKITFDDRVPEIVSGKPRQVDASIRSEVGTTPILIIVECQKRGRAADKTWFEQLKTKKEEVGANSVLAVTHKQVGPSAQEAARRFGIEVRCLRELKPNEAVQIETGIPGLTMSIGNVRATFDYDHGRPIHVNVGFADADPAIQLDSNLQQALSRDPWNTPFLFDQKGERGVTVKRIVDEGRRRGWDPAGGAPVGVDCVATLRVGLNGDWYSPTPSGLRRVVGVEIGYQTKRGVEGVDLAQHAYVGSTRLTQVADGGLRLPDGKSEFRITFALDERGFRGGVEHRDPDTEGK